MEIADDQVESGPLDGESTLHSWREVEVELGPAGTEKDLKRAGEALAGLLARPQYHEDQAGPGTRPNVAERAGTTRLNTGTVGELVAAYMAAQCDVLASNDVGLRTGAPEVHKTRVAARRLRSTLRIFGDISRRRSG